MSRDKFISDSLYNMRDSFKRNHIEHQPTTGAGDDTADSSEINSISREIPEPIGETAVKTTASAPKMHLPQLAGFRNDGEAGRDRRDLEGRLLRDLSFIEAEEVFAEQHTAALKRFKSVIEKELSQLQELDKSNSDPAVFKSAIERLRIEYFHSSGRFEAEVSRRNASNKFATPAEINMRPAPAWQVPAAIIASAIIVSLTMLMLFGG